MDDINSSSEKKYILAIDQGTTSSGAIIFDKSGSIVNIQIKNKKGSTLDSSSKV